MAGMALRSLKQSLHLSPSQMRCYLGCSLQYYFRYVAGLAPERTSINLLFGSAIHVALDRHYRTLKSSGEAERFPVLAELFADTLSTDLAACREEVSYGREMADADGALQMGKALLEVFCREIDLEECEVAEVEYPLSAPLGDGEGGTGEVNLIGVIDLLLRDPQGRLIAVDHKTARNPYTQASVDEDLQLSAYAYLLKENGLVGVKEEVHCRFDVLRKLKAPKLEHHPTVRSSRDLERFTKIASAVLTGIDRQVYLPCPSWQCGDCPHGEACRRW